MCLYELRFKDNFTENKPPVVNLKVYRGCSRAGWFESHFFGTLEDKFFHVQAYMRAIVITLAVFQIKITLTISILILLGKNGVIIKPEKKHIISN